MGTPSFSWAGDEPECTHQEGSVTFYEIFREFFALKMGAVKKKASAKVSSKAEKVTKAVPMKAEKTVKNVKKKAVIKRVSPTSSAKSKAEVKSKVSSPKKTTPISGEIIREKIYNSSE